MLCLNFLLSFYGCIIALPSVCLLRAFLFAARRLLPAEFLGVFLNACPPFSALLRLLRELVADSTSSSSASHVIFRVH